MLRSRTWLAWREGRVRAALVVLLLALVLVPVLVLVLVAFDFSRAPNNDLAMRAANDV